jgi:hypothetical protein
MVLAVHNFCNLFRDRSHKEGRETSQLAYHATVERRERRPGVPMSLVLYRGIVGMFPKSARACAITESLLIERACRLGRPSEKASTCRSRLTLAHLGHMGLSRPMIKHSKR